MTRSLTPDQIEEILSDVGTEIHQENSPVYQTALKIRSGYEQQAEDLVNKRMEERKKEEEASRKADEEADPWTPPNTSSYLSGPAFFQEKAKEMGERFSTTFKSTSAGNVENISAYAEGEALVTPEEVALEEQGSFGVEALKDFVIGKPKEIKVTKENEIEAAKRNQDNALADYFRSVSETQAEIIEAHPEWQENRVELSFSTALDPSYIGQTMGQLVPTMLASFGVGTVATIASGGNLAVGLGAGAGVTYLMEGGMAYKDARDNGLSVDESLKIGRTVGAVNGILEVLPMGVWIENAGLRKIVMKSLGKKFIEKKLFNTTSKKVLSQIVTESVTEVGQEISSILGESKYKDISGSEIMKRLVESGYAGALGGLAFGAGGVGINKTIDKVKEAEKTKALKLPSADMSYTDMLAYVKENELDVPSRKKADLAKAIDDAEASPRQKAIRATDTLSKHLGSKIVKPLEAQRASRSQNKLVKFAKKALGLDVVFVEGMGDLANGAVDPANPTTIFIDKDSVNPEITVFGHEFTHTLEQTKPELFNQLTEIMNEMDSEAVSTRVSALTTAYEAMKEKDPTTVVPNESQILKEILGDFVGEQMGTKSFWETAQAKSPELVQKMINSLKRLLRKMGGEVQDFNKTDSFFKSQEAIDRAIKIASDVVAKAGGTQAKAGVKGDVQLQLNESEQTTIAKNFEEDEFSLVEAVATANRLTKPEEFRKYPWVMNVMNELEGLGDLNRQAQMPKEDLEKEQMKFIVRVKDLWDATDNEQGQVSEEFSIARDEGVITEDQGKRISEFLKTGKMPSLKQIGTEKSAVEMLSDIKKLGLEREAKRQGNVQLQAKELEKTTKTPEFKKWFGKSKVVNEDGSPKVVYHGTDENFESFEAGRDTQRFLMMSKFDVKTQGFFFSESESDALEYGDNSIPAYLRSENPLKALRDHNISSKDPLMAKKIFDDMEYILEPIIEVQDGKDVIDLMGELYVEVTPEKMEDGSWVNDVADYALHWAIFDNEEVVSRMEERGYDSAIVEEPNDQSGMSWFVVDPTQIKSVNNRGTFSETDPRIMFQVREKVAKREKESESKRVGTGIPGKKAQSGMQNNVNIGMDEMTSTEMGKIAAKLYKEFDSESPLPKFITRKRSPKAKVQDMISFMSDNLLALHDAFDQGVREAASLWYDGGNEIVNTEAQNYDLTPEQLAGIIARLSPQKDWYQNVQLALNVADVMKNERDTKVSRAEYSEEMGTVLDLAIDKDERASRDKILSQIEGHSVSDLLGKGHKVDAGWALRLISMKKHGTDYDILMPNGSRGGLKTTGGGGNERLIWQSVSNLSKAMDIIIDGSPDGISKALGFGGHKIRSFYNNIIAPNSKNKDVTVDTHAVSASMLFPFGSNSHQVTTNFSGGRSGGINSGSYPIIREAYIDAAEKRGILPRQMQSITWEAVRQLFSNKSTPVKKAVHKKWMEAKNAEEARAAILGGGISPPSWVGQGSTAGLAEGLREAPGSEGLSAGDSADRNRPRLGTPATGVSLQIKGEAGFESYRRAAEERFSKTGDRPFRRGDQKDLESGLTGAEYSLNPPDQSYFKKEGISNTPLYEVNDYNAFHDAIANSVKSLGKDGASVYVYPVEDYKDMRLFLTSDSKAGFAIKDDGGIVSAFAGKEGVHRDSGRYTALEMLTLAVQEGGQKLDAFDTYLPAIYETAGFKIFKRDKWNEEYKPKGWDKDHFKAYNNGEPDVVYMEYKEADTPPLFQAKKDSKEETFVAERTSASSWSGMDQETKGQAFRRSVEDSNIRLKVLNNHIEAASGGKLNENLDLWAQKDMLPRITANRLERINEEKVEFVKRLTDADLTIDQVHKVAHALHAEERNDEMNARMLEKDPEHIYQGGLSGMHTSIANRILKKATPEELKFAQEVIKMADEQLDSEVKAGLTTQEDADRYRKTYKNYLPLFREMDDESTSGVGNTMSITGKESKKAKGSLREVQNVVGNVFYRKERAVIRELNNEVGNTIIKLVEEYPELGEMFDIKKQQYVPRFNSDGELQYMDPQFDFAKNVIGTKVDGKQYFITIKDQKIADAIKNTNMARSGRILKAMKMAIGIWSGFKTRWRPEFIVTNFQRDLGEALINLGVESGMLKEEKKGLRRAIVKNLFPSQLRIFKYLRGGKDALVDEFFSEGGDVGNFWGANLDNAQKSLEQIEKEVRGEGLQKVKNMGQTALKFWDDVNSMVELGIRFATYEQLTKRGMSKKKAIQAVADLTINFSRQGEISPTLKAFYGFINPAIQGSSKVVRTVSDKRGRAQVMAAVSGLTALGFAVRMVSMMIDEDEDERISEWDKGHKIAIADGKGGYYNFWNMPYGYAVFYGLGSNLAEVAMGKKDFSETLPILFDSAINSFSPFDTDINSLIPTLAKPIYEVDQNKGWHGGPIRPEQIFTDTPKPDHEVYFKNAHEGMIFATEIMSKAGWEMSPNDLQYYYDQYLGGPFEFVTSTIEAGARGVDGEFDASKTPFVRQVKKEIRTKSWAYGVIYDTLNDVYSKDVTYTQERRFFKAVQVGLDEGIYDKDRRNGFIKSYLKAKYNITGRPDTKLNKAKIKMMKPGDRALFKSAYK